MYDLILRGGTVVDGKRSQPYAADICIREGRIARIAPEGGEEAREVVDVSGLAVAPGFIDIHTHSDACPLVDYEPESKLHQGITTEITGNCGISILPSLPENSREIVQYFFDDTSMFSQVVLNEKDRSLDGLYGVEEYARAVAAHGCTANYGQLVGHGTLRGAVMGFVDRDPGPEEMERLKDLLERELRAGAFGMSLGLIYPPSAFCKREELVELAKVLKTHHTLGLKGGILVANPIPQAYSMDADAINAVIDQAVAEADEKGIHGKQTTPFLLAKVKEITGGDSLEANIQLVFNNAKLAAQTAVAYSALS